MINKMIKKGILLIGLFTAGTMQAQDVAHYTPGTLDEGVVYYLPKTRLEVKVRATKVTYTPGELCQYANRYLRLQDVSSQPDEQWEINSIRVTAIGVPDAEKAYSIKLKDKMVTSQVELTEEGIIRAINTKTPVAEKPQQEKPAEKPERIDPKNFMTEEMLMVVSTNKLAELVAKEIYNIRESKNNLTRGQADYMPQDGTALKLMLANLEEQEKALTGLFAGHTDRTEKTFTFQIEPEQEINNQVVCRFSKKLGVLKKDNLAGEPIYINISNESSFPPANEEAKAKKKLGGVIYNIPGTGRVSISSSSKSYYEEELPITQFGETEVLTDNLFNKKVNTRVIFSPVTGGIVKIDKD